MPDSGDGLSAERIAQWAEHAPDARTACVYCGAVYDLDWSDPVAFTAGLRLHLAACPEHPLSAVVAESDRMRGILDTIARLADGSADVATLRRIRELATSRPPAHPERVRIMEDVT